MSCEEVIANNLYLYILKKAFMGERSWKEIFKYEKSEVENLVSHSLWSNNHIMGVQNIYIKKEK